MRDLTTRQQQILALIRQHISDTGFPPTRAEIATQLGFRSPNAAEEHLKALARKGVIELAAGTSRGIRLKLLPDSIDEVPRAVQIALSLPLVGRVAAWSRSCSTARSRSARSCGPLTGCRLRPSGIPCWRLSRPIC